MSGRWWRAYSRARHDPKLLKLSDKHFRWWFNLVCAASDHDGALPSHADLAVEFRVSGAAMTQVLDALVSAGLLDHDETGIHPHNWNGLQYKSDVSNDRVKRFRERHRNGECNVTETPSESEAETETEKKGAKAPTARRKEPTDEQRFKLPSDWRPSADDCHHAVDKGLDPETVDAAFLDYFTEGRGRNEKRTLAGWSRRYRVWCNTDADRKPANRGRAGVRHPPDGGDVGAFARAAARLERDEPV